MRTHKHNLTNYKLASMPAGVLIPIGIQEVLPGDTFQQATQALIRLDPMIAPTMHPLHAKIHHWFVPHRLVFEDWEDFITGGAYGDTPPTFPTMTVNQSSGAAIHDPLDYYGIAQSAGVDESNTFTVSALPLRGMNLIYNEWYRDQDLMSEAALSTASGSDVTTNRSLLSVAWERDYFTTARPWAQKGTTVSIPLSGTVDVELDPTTGVSPKARLASNHALSGAFNPVATDASSNFGTGSGTDIVIDPDGTLDVDLSNGAISLEDLQLGFALKRFEEMRALYGSRYTEYLRYLGVKSADARLQRPEYLGGGKQTIQMSEILQTAEGTDPVGTLRGHGIGAMRSNRYRRYFTEHGYIHSFMIIRPITMYQQGIPRHFLKTTKEEFWQKELEHIGHQEVQNQEVYAFQTDALKTAAFGYVPRYQEYRQCENSVAGLFRTTLNDWHMSRIFTAAPSLNGSFVTSTPTRRIFAVDSEFANYKVMIHHSIQARRLVTNNISSFVR